MTNRLTFTGYSHNQNNMIFIYSRQSDNFIITACSNYNRLGLEYKANSVRHFSLIYISIKLTGSNQQNQTELI